MEVERGWMVGWVVKARVAWERIVTGSCPVTLLVDSFFHETISSGWVDGSKEGE